MSYRPHLSDKYNFTYIALCSVYSPGCDSGQDLSMRADLRRKTKCIFFRIINATAKASGNEPFDNNDEYVIDRKNAAPFSLSPSTSNKSRY